MKYTILDSNVIMDVLELFTFGILTENDIKKLRSGELIDPPSKLYIKFKGITTVEGKDLEEYIYTFEIIREFRDGRKETIIRTIPMIILDYFTNKYPEVRDAFSKAVENQEEEIVFNIPLMLKKSFPEVCNSLLLIGNKDPVICIYEITVPFIKKGEKPKLKQLYLLRQDEKLLICPSMDYYISVMNLISDKILRESLIEEFKMGINNLKMLMDKISKEYKLKSVWNPDINLEIEAELHDKNYEIILNRINNMYDITIKDIINNKTIFDIKNTDLNNIDKYLSAIYGSGIGLEEIDELIKRITLGRKIGKIKYASLIDLIMRSYKDAGNELITMDKTLTEEITATLPE